jgi:hypothetical protein
MKMAKEKKTNYLDVMKMAEEKKTNYLDDLYLKRDLAVERFVAAWEKYKSCSEDEDVCAELESALDAVTLANVTSTLEWASGPHEQ